MDTVGSCRESDIKSSLIDSLLPSLLLCHKEKTSEIEVFSITFIEHFPFALTSKFVQDVEQFFCPYFISSAELPHASLLS